jgi:serine/threonine protein kinase
LNLLVDQDYECLKIINFGDTAMRVQDEDEEVDDQYGTKSWMAPKVEKKLRHSPIKADRWAGLVGAFFCTCFDKFRKENKPLRAFPRVLEVDNPKKRPSLLEWSSYLTPPLSGSDVKNVKDADEREKGQPKWKVDGENVQ